jgi:hypothetical protein
MAVLLSACAIEKPPAATPAPAAQTVSRSAEHIYVTEESLDTACYQEVGEVSYVEPFAEAATDPEHTVMADELRKAAVEKYPNRVDAIINMHTEDRNIGIEVVVSGEAVKLEPQSKVDCKLPDTIAAAMVNFATGSKSRGERRGAVGAGGYNGPAGTSNTAAETSGADSGKKIKENLRRAMISTMPGQTGVNEQALSDRVLSQQEEIKSLRAELDQIVSRRCEGADISASQCASLQKNAELEQQRVPVALPNQGSDNGMSVFEVQNLIQAQDELIARLRREIADMNEAAHGAGGASAPN